MKGSFHIMILTGEPSGDFHAGPLIRHLKVLKSDTRISGIGGPAMTAEGADVFFPIDRLSAMGLIQVARQFSSIKQAFSAFRHRLDTDPPDLVIFIDYPGFNLKAAGYLKTRYDIPTLYYIAPKVWAWNAARLDKIKAYMDHVALILPFEAPIYRKKKIAATYVGNPLVDEYPWPPPGRPSHLADDDAPVIGLLPGSRAAEVRTLLPVMLDTAEKIRREKKNVQFLISAASKARAEQIRGLLGRHPLRHRCRLVEGRPLPIFETAHMLIAASGTVTLEAALCLLPTILVYKVSSLTWTLGSLLVKVKYVGLANLIAGEEVMPERLQQDATPKVLCDAALAMLADLQGQAAKLGKVRKLLGKPGAPRRTARIAMDLIRKRC